MKSSARKIGIIFSVLYILYSQTHVFAQKSNQESGTESTQESNPAAIDQTKKSFWIIQHSGIFIVPQSTPKSHKDSKHLSQFIVHQSSPRNSANPDESKSNVSDSSPNISLSRFPVLTPRKRSFLKNTTSTQNPESLTPDEIRELHATIAIPVHEPTAFLLYDGNSAPKRQRDLEPIKKTVKQLHPLYVVHDRKNPRMLEKLDRPLVLGDPALLRQLGDSKKTFPQLVIVLPDGRKRVLSTNELDATNPATMIELSQSDGFEEAPPSRDPLYMELVERERLHSDFKNWANQEYGVLLPDDPLSVSHLTNFADPLTGLELAIEYANQIDAEYVNSKLSQMTVICHLFLHEALSKRRDDFYREQDLSNLDYSDDRGRKQYQDAMESLNDLQIALIDQAMDKVDPANSELKSRFASLKTNWFGAGDANVNAYTKNSSSLDLQFDVAQIIATNYDSRGYFASDVIRSLLEQNPENDFNSLEEIDQELTERRKHIDKTLNLLITKSDLEDVKMSRNYHGYSALKSFGATPEDFGLTIDAPDSIMNYIDAYSVLRTHAVRAFQAVQAIDDLPLPDTPRERIAEINKRIEFLEKTYTAGESRETESNVLAPLTQYPQFRDEFLRVREKQIRALSDAFDAMKLDSSDSATASAALDELGTTFGLESAGAVIREQAQVDHEDIEKWRRQELERLQNWNVSRNISMSEFERIQIEGQIARLQKLMQKTGFVRK